MIEGTPKKKFREYDVALIEEDPETGEHVLTFPVGVIEGLGWVEGDTLIWSDNGDRTWTLSKK